MKNQIKGACHCKAVQLEITDKPRAVVNCHCDDCKKRNGSAFSTYVTVANESLLINKGEQYIKPYTIEGQGIKYFCSQCGSPLYNKNQRIPGMSMLFYGLFVPDVVLQPSINVYCESKHQWVDSISQITSFDRSFER